MTHLLECRADANAVDMSGENSLQLALHSHATLQTVDAGSRLLTELIVGGVPVTVSVLARLGFDRSREDVGRQILPSLQQLCEQTLCNDLRAEDVISLFHLAQLCGADMLRSECERVLTQQFNSLVGAGAFRAAKIDGVELLTGILSDRLTEHLRCRTPSESVPETHPHHTP